FEQGWRRALHDGLISDTSFPPKRVQVKSENLKTPSTAQHQSPTANRHSALTDLELHFRPDPNVWDGRFANNGWLQECPRPVSKLTWDNALLISAALAQRHHLASDDVVELSLQKRTLRAPVWIMPGQAENSVTLPLGYGRERAGH